MHRARNDDERRRLLERLKAEFFLPPLLEHKYRLEEVIGEGSYGVVCSAVNTETGERVAVKRIMRVFEEAPEATRTLRELKFLRLLKGHENIITIKDVLLPSDRDNFDDVFVVLELMPTDLTRVLRSKIELSSEHIRWLVFQLTRGIFYLHTSRVFHRDLKPSNILINARCDLRIVDFGLSRAAFDNQDPDVFLWTDYVATRWYRAPELIMATSKNYTTAIDMWSIGCIFAEMLNNGRPMFPGHNPEDQLQLILNFCGSPSPDTIANVREPRARSLLARMPPCTRRPVTEYFPHADPLAQDLLSKILEFDPHKRISAEEALQHPYLQMDVVVRGQPIDIEEFAFERKNLSVTELRPLFLEEILKYHPDRRHMFLEPRDQPVLQYVPVDQASRFRDAMVATQNGTEPPRAWESMPNQRLTHYYQQAQPGMPGGGGGAGGVVAGAGGGAGADSAEGAGGGGGVTAAGGMAGGQHSDTHSQAGSVVQRGPSDTDGTGGMTTASTHAASNQPALQGSDERMGEAGRPQVWTSNDARVRDEEGGNNGNEEPQLMRYASKFSSVESASSAMAFRHDSGQAGVAGRRVSETVESMIDPTQEMVPDVNVNDKMGT